MPTTWHTPWSRLNVPTTPPSADTVGAERLAKCRITWISDAITLLFVLLNCSSCFRYPWRVDTRCVVSCSLNLIWNPHVSWNRMVIPGFNHPFQTNLANTLEYRWYTKFDCWWTHVDTALSSNLILIWWDTLQAYTMIYFHPNSLNDLVISRSLPIWHYVCISLASQPSEVAHEFTELGRTPSHDQPWLVPTIRYRSNLYLLPGHDHDLHFLPVCCLILHPNPAHPTHQMSLAMYQTTCYQQLESPLLAFINPPTPFFSTPLKPNGDPKSAHHSATPPLNSGQPSEHHKKTWPPNCSRKKNG